MFLLRYCKYVSGTGIKTFLYVPLRPSPVPDHLFGKELYLIVLTKKLLSVMRIFSFAMMTNMKKFIRIKSLNTEQCPARLSPKIIHPPPVFPTLSKNLFFFISSPKK